MNDNNIKTIKLNCIVSYHKWNYVIPTDEIIETVHDKYVYCYVFDYNDFSGYATYIYGQCFPINDMTENYTIGWLTSSEADKLTDLNFHGFVEKRLDIA